MKKILSLLMTMLLMIACLSGCGGGVDTSKNKPQADKDDITITVWSDDGGAQAVWEEITDEWNSTTGNEKNISSFINICSLRDFVRAGCLPEGFQSAG